ncbi:bis(5'-nucleosyl)-tetraphosphatase (symmetrical) [Buchnera aphidicola (Thelaxes californica)]|uniref:bis(5'-nucleosyl)-tetraphosphatase (symmetrical) n=1 Tax=Buchnera aphidicola (Thelaxes californica) TaxID=1315998 RepID=A0A4D6YNP5_9GAMM|nr:bis(5'-nucleosyl)-tetraphosphatase (symmetrical) ApaH [Buchnera aphidicola]QCI26665.1 bis(5'-nucleosyl)-tetraphosphatase (symmetrical) [Buchnera aphidicola (Thelaxes californica)]
MTIYLVGDIHGCFDQLKLILKKVKFNKNIDQLWVTGDLVSRGPKSFEVVQYLFSLEDAVYLVLGNHDLFFILSYLNYQKGNPLRKDTISFFQNKESEILIQWLRRQPLLRVNYQHKFILSHAGIFPQWTLSVAQKCARNAEKILSSDQCCEYLNKINIDKNNFWNDSLTPFNNFAFTINALTRIRYCESNGNLNMLEKSPPSLKDSDNNLIPWFLMENSIPIEFSFVFGHWSALDGKGTPKRFFPLDTGCCWGKKLTLLRWEDKKFFFQPF